MATFDTTRLDGRQYTIGIATHTIRLQKTVEDFMDIVRPNPSYLVANRQLISQFCRLIDHDKTFPLAAMVVPELRLPQSHDTTENTIINIILRTPGIKQRRPAAPLVDTTNANERRLVYQELRGMIEYLAFDDDREDTATPEQL